MTGYKRNQVEEAIAGMYEPQRGKPSPELRIKLKRLLETDREMNRTAQSNDPEQTHYAFYGIDAPGSGVEVWFSEYEAFALSTGLRLMSHGWPQGFVVSILRRVRVDLEREHGRILKMDSNALFDQEAIRRAAKEGDMAFDNTDPVLLTIISNPGNLSDKQSTPLACSIWRGPDKAMQWAKQKGAPGTITMFELVTAAHWLASKLKDTKPRPRGRGA